MKTTTVFENEQYYIGKKDDDIGVAPCLDIIEIGVAGIGEIPINTLKASDLKEICERISKEMFEMVEVYKDYQEKYLDSEKNGS